MNLEKNTIHSKGKATRIQPRLILLLKILYQERGKVVRKEVLMKSVWPDTIVTEDSLTKAISKLRSLLDSELKTSSIQTVSGVGYSLRKPRLVQYLKQQRITIALSSVIILLLYVLLGSGIVQWVATLNS